ncbi:MULTISPECIES: DUF4170 domain-containing protein [Limibacillus]|jgi:hypothetical protein|uniref:DUF4170 domain-containing protein n=1 Tax=Limibacillus halophilus TaxID=1579333 RepID=A0A839SYL8_9PROT|nr:DUF4170 domain-containing protein [Limibacillus halophilus]MBB3066714.1 hypothetical protein [Limibacillus halophilus]
MQKYWVVGGEYKDTRFDCAIAGGEDWAGPFETYEEAEKEWARLAWMTVDDCHKRYRIERMDPEVPPRCTD